MPAARKVPSGPAQVVEAIREAILSGDYVPERRLVEADLSERFEVGRGAVRSALLQLDSEGLVERIPNRGARVRAVSLAEAIEITEVRMVVEALCAAKAAQRATEAEIAELCEMGERMAAAVDAGAVMTCSELNNRLHRRVLEMSGQGIAEGVIERLRGQSVRHQFRLAVQPGRPSVSLPEHLAIIDAICRRNPEAAERAVGHHIGSVIDALRSANNSPSFPVS
ncbi:GntR family transcriptional regulator [Streptomyces sp. NBC_01451]|uniref:GntR family transcriptional regulator n=1 Tax=Streptomyces sp. NBC_01451 TaxID=2903872 RepID=UPI002E31F5DB|nr:GntR family transcriptional regulator [Streptomyces sp. NBC_01451]